MNTQRINDAIAGRVSELLAQDSTAAQAESRFYDATAKLEKLDPALFKELDGAWVDVSDAIISRAWLDGWQCGRNPDLLVLAGGPVQ